jgi:roadblock/LC7 domain-containing protein
VVVDGAGGKEFDGIMAGTPVFSPDSKRVAYAAERGDKWVVVVDGAEGKEFDGIMAGTPVFSPDSKRVAYAPERGNKRMAVVDGVEGKEYEAFLKGSRLVFDSPSQFHTLALRGDEFLRVEVEIVTPAAEPSVPK